MLHKVLPNRRIFGEKPSFYCWLTAKTGNSVRCVGFCYIDFPRDPLPAFFCYLVMLPKDNPRNSKETGIQTSLLNVNWFNAREQKVHPFKDIALSDIALTFLEM